MTENPDTSPQQGAVVADTLNEEVDARMRADRLGLDYIQLQDFEIDHGLFESIPVELMFRYHFIPYRMLSDRLQIVVADPTDVLMLAAPELLIGHAVDVAVGTRSAIPEILTRSGSSQRRIGGRPHQL